MEFIVEGTPGTCSCMTLMEIFVRRRKLLNATLLASGYVQWTKANMPVIVLFDAPHPQAGCSTVVVFPSSSDNGSLCNIDASTT